MDIQKYFAILNELHSNYSQLKEAQDLNRSMALLQCDKIDIEWYNSANSFIESVLNILRLNIISTNIVMEDAETLILKRCQTIL